LNSRSVSATALPLFGLLIGWLMVSFDFIAVSRERVVNSLVVAQLRTSGSPPVRRARHEALITLVVSSTCAFSRSDSLATLWQQARTRAERDSFRSGRIPVFRIVVLDNNLAQGLRFATRFGSFHEVTLGRNWDNSANDEIFGSSGGSGSTPPAVPAITVGLRDYSGPGVASGVRQEARMVGLSEIAQWLSVESPGRAAHLAESASVARMGP
jgi:hypothetical protein